MQGERITAEVETEKAIAEENTPDRPAEQNEEGEQKVGDSCGK